MKNLFFLNIYNKKKMNKIFKIIFFFLILIQSSCEKENLAQDNYIKNQSISVVNAKKWFEEFKSTGSVNPLFSDLILDWNTAYISTLTDGSKAITIPILNQNQYTGYSSKKLLYIYSYENKKFTATLFELITNDSKVDSITKFDLDTFDGYIINWDLIRGFVRGSKFKNSKDVNDIYVKVIPPNTDERLYIKNKNSTAKNAIDLDEVIIINDYKKGGSIVLQESKQNRTDNSGSGSAQDYINDPRGGGGGGGGFSHNDTIQNPCEKIKQSLKNPAYKAKLDALKKLTSLTKESGFSEDKFGVFTTLKSNSSDAATLIKDVNRVGFMHTHLNPYDKPNADGDLDPVEPIKMFSPEDVRQFLIIAVNAQNNTIPINDIYGTMVSSTGTYQLKFTGNVADINKKNNAINWDTLDKTYIKYLDKNIETGFLQFLKDKIGIDGIELYKIEASGSSQKTLDSSGKLKTINCN